MNGDEAQKRMKKQEKTFIILIVIIMIVGIVGVVINSMIMENDNMERESDIGFYYVKAYVEEGENDTLKIKFLNENKSNFEIKVIGEAGNVSLELERTYYSMGMNDTILVNMSKFYDIPMDIEIEITDLQNHLKERRYWQRVDKDE